MFVGLAVHKDSIEIAVAEEGRDGEVRVWGKIGDAMNLARLHRAGELSSVYVTVHKCHPCTQNIVLPISPFAHPVILFSGY